MENIIEETQALHIHMEQCKESLLATIAESVFLRNAVQLVTEGFKQRFDAYGFLSTLMRVHQHISVMINEPNLEEHFYTVFHKFFQSKPQAFLENLYKQFSPAVLGLSQKRKQVHNLLAGLIGLHAGRFHYPIEDFLWQHFGIELSVNRAYHKAKVNACINQLASVCRIFICALEDVLCSKQDKKEMKQYLSTPALSEYKAISRENRLAIEHVLYEHLIPYYQSYLNKRTPSPEWKIKKHQEVEEAEENIIVVD